MGFIAIESSNEDLGWVLGKNPESGMICKTLRSGIIYGWYTNPTTYIVRFVDWDDAMSFSSSYNDKFNYLNSLQYSSPLLPACIVSELFSSTLNKINCKDIECSNKFIFELVKLNNKALNFIDKLNGHIKKFQIIVKTISCPNMFKLEIQSESTINDLLNYIYILGNLLNIIVVGRVDKPDINQLEKMLNFMIKIDIPYYPRYLIKTHMFNQEQFVKLQDKIEIFKNYQVKMYWGNSQTQRFEWISSHIEYSNPNLGIVDFGCGEGYYVKKLLPLINIKTKYIVWDLDSEELDLVKYFKVKNPQYSNLIISENEQYIWDNLDQKYSWTILLSEVFEHIPQFDAIELLNKIKSNGKFSKLIITTPDVGFNIHYSIDNKINSRHKDHVYEYTQEELKKIIDKVFGQNYNKQFYNIGDMIDSNSITQGFIIEPIDLF